MIDVLYILGSGSRWNNNELRYSLRSLQKFGENVERVFVTGEDPGFLAKKVIYNYQPDPGPNRACNALHKILWTCQNTDISERFVLNYDDNFLLEKVDLERYPHYFKGDLPDNVKNKNTYRICLNNTYNLLKTAKKPTLDFSVHCPIILNKKSFIGLMRIWNKMKQIKSGYAIRSVYCNWYKIPGQYMSDSKVRNIENRERLEEVIRGRHVFSIQDRAIHKGVAEFLEEKFPRKSKYEKGK